MLYYQHKTIIDKEGRLLIPNFLSKCSQNTMIYISPSSKHSLLISTSEEFMELADKIIINSSDDEKGRDYQRLFFSTTSQTLISNNLVTIPIKLKNLANLKTKVILVKSSYGLEVWDETFYGTFNSKTETNRLP